MTVKFEILKQVQDDSAGADGRSAGKGVHRPTEDRKMRYLYRIYGAVSSTALYIPTEEL